MWAPSFRPSLNTSTNILWVNYYKNAIKKKTISKIHFMKESTSFLSMFSPSNETFMKVCENSKVVQRPRVEKCLLKHLLVFNF